MTTTCQHCGRAIRLEDGTWIDPEATGDDVTWRETCDMHDTFTAEHEPNTWQHDYLAWCTARARRPDEQRKGRR